LEHNGVPGTNDNCHVCDYNIGNGNGYTICGYNGSTPFWDYTGTVNISPPNGGAGLNITGGVFLAYGAILGPAALLTLVVHGVPVFPHQFPDQTLPPGADGFYYLCGNCMYNTWNLTNISMFTNPNPNGNYIVQLYSTGTDIFCIAQTEFIFSLADVSPPVCDLEVYTVTVGDTDSSPKTITPANLISGKTDNCDVYPNLVDFNTVSPSTVDIWNYPIATINVCCGDSSKSGNINCQDGYVDIVPSPYPITYPSPNQASIAYPIQNIIIRWENYAPLVNAKTLVDIYVVPQQGGANLCGAGAQTVYLATNYPYYKFELYYNDETHLLVTTNTVPSYPSCHYYLYMVWIRYDGTEVTFPYYHNSNLAQVTFFVNS